MDTRYRGALDFGYKVAPVLGIAPNSHQIGAARDGTEEKRTHEIRRAYSLAFAERGVHVITDTQLCNSRKKIKCFHNSVV